MKLTRSLLTVLVAGGLAGLLLSGCTLGKPSPTPTPKATPKPKLSQPANMIPVEERPFVNLIPTAGREVIIELGAPRKPANSADFELEYNAGEKVEAAIGALVMPEKDIPTSKTILLGSKSGGGKITYHEGVTGGTLTLSFFGPNGVKDGYKLANGWRYFDNKKPSALFSSQDVKFSVDVGKMLNSSPYVIIYQNPGIPGEKAWTGATLAGPYSIAGTDGAADGKATVSITVSEGKKADIWAWNGTSWAKQETTMKGNTASTMGSLLKTYIAVEK